MYVGIVHSTTGIKVACHEGQHPVTTFQIDRKDLEAASNILELLAERIELADVSLATVTYAYGNGISTIQNIENVSNRGVNDLLGLGYETGAGALVFDQLRDSAIPTIAVPGVHRELETLHEYFQHYSTLSGADKVAALRYAYDCFCAEYPASGNFIWACASSSCMAGLVCDGRLRGFFHWVGPIHGWPDPEAVRQGLEIGFDDVFMQCGLVARSGQPVTDVHDISDRQLLERVYWATIHNIYSLYPFSAELGTGSLDGIVLSGRLIRREQPIELGRRLYERCLDIAPVLFAEPYAAAQGAALIARDVANGTDHVLGIPVGDVPV